MHFSTPYMMIAKNHSVRRKSLHDDKNDLEDDWSARTDEEERFDSTTKLMSKKSNSMNRMLRAEAIPSLILASFTVNRRSPMIEK
jgi:hypothetical protein